jgi:hypothetical protein
LLFSLGDRELRAWKKGAVGGGILIVILMIFFLQLNDTPTEKYNNHMSAARESLHKHSIFWNETKVAALEGEETGDFSKAIEAQNKRKMSTEEALSHYQSALALAEGTNYEEWTECMVIGTELLIKSNEHMIESLKFWSEGKKNKSIESMNTAKAFDKKSLDNLAICQEIDPRKYDIV